MVNRVLNIVGWIGMGLVLAAVAVSRVPALNQYGDYARWHASAQRLLAALGADEHAAVFGGNASAFYRLRSDPAG